MIANMTEIGEVNITRLDGSFPYYAIATGFAEFLPT